MIRATIATATDPKRVLSATARLPATVPVPGGVAQRGRLLVDAGEAVEHQLGQEGVEVGEVTVQDALGEACLYVTARLVSVFGPSRSRTRSAASKSCSFVSRRATPVGTVRLLALRRLTSATPAPSIVGICPL